MHEMPIHETRAPSLTRAPPLTGYSVWRVVLVSVVGTLIEWYDFFIFGSLGGVLSLKFYPPANDALPTSPT